MPFIGTIRKTCHAFGRIPNHSSFRSPSHAPILDFLLFFLHSPTPSATMPLSKRSHSPHVRQQSILSAPSLQPRPRPNLLQLGQGHGSWVPPGHRPRRHPHHGPLLRPHGQRLRLHVPAGHPLADRPVDPALPGNPRQLLRRPRRPLPRSRFRPPRGRPRLGPPHPHRRLRRRRSHRHPRNRRRSRCRKNHGRPLFRHPRQRRLRRNRRHPPPPPTPPPPPIPPNPTGSKNPRPASATPPPTPPSPSTTPSPSSTNSSASAP